MVCCRPSKAATRFRKGEGVFRCGLPTGMRRPARHGVGHFPKVGQNHRKVTAGGLNALPRVPPLENRLLEPLDLLRLGEFRPRSPGDGLVGYVVRVQRREPAVAIEHQQFETRTRAVLPAGFAAFAGRAAGPGAFWFASLHVLLLKDVVSQHDEWSAWCSPRIRIWKKALVSRRVASRKSGSAHMRW
jgi:hypothetical protein